ncbi:MAG: hypothetical protein K6L76_10625 [Agarilytica sp.]
MTLNDLLNKTCLLGLSYFDTDNALMKQEQMAGEVVSIHEENGISIKLAKGKPSEHIATDSDTKIFVIPPHLACWFKAPEGKYRDQDGNLLIENPNYFVTWDIHKTQDEKKGDHEWWEWVPRTAAPKVN